MGAGYDAMVLTVVTAFLGVFVMVVLAKKGVKAAVLLGMLFSSVIYWAGSAIFLHVNPFASLVTASFVPPFADMVSTTLFKFDFAGFVNIGWFTAITLVITFCMIDMFDTIGTLVGTASRAGMVDKDGNMPKMKEALLSDAIGTIAGCYVKDGKVTRLAVCGKEAVASGGKAGDIIKAIAPICGGKGGGKPDSAMGGGTEVSKVDDARAAVDDLILSKLG